MADTDKKKFTLTVRVVSYVEVEVEGTDPGNAEDHLCDNTDLLSAALKVATVEDIDDFEVVEVQDEDGNYIPSKNEEEEDEDLDDLEDEEDVEEDVEETDEELEDPHY